MIWQIIHIIDILLWIIVAVSVLYVLFFALVATLHKKKIKDNRYLFPASKLNRFVILYPAYKEDAVIKESVSTFLGQTYPKDKYDITVVSDHMSAETNEWLASQPVQLLRPVFKKSSKAKSMQYAVANLKDEYDYIVILDADNIVDNDFLYNLNTFCYNGYRAIQCHRCAKNSDNDIAVLDGVSEEINNTIFRRAHNYIGLSSALIGSGMCFSYKWFKDNVNKLSTAGEDRELEVLLITQKVFVHYEENIHVYDEKVSNADNFQRQRLRWMTVQIQCLLQMLPHTFKALLEGDMNYLDKTLQQALIPRSILIVLILFLAFFMTLFIHAWDFKWFVLFFLLCLGIFLSIPPVMRKRSILSKITKVPHLAWKMIKNIKDIDKKSTDFIHTKHKK